MHETTYLVTGATDGIGKQLALQLAQTQARVLVHGRSHQRVDSAVSEIRRLAGNFDVEPLVTDLSLIQQVRGMAARVKEKCDHLDALVNNAGVIMSQRVVTAEGLETTFVVNHLAPFLLTHLLLPLLEAAPAGRVVNVSSNYHFAVREVDFANLQGEKSYQGNAAYALSKLGNLWFTFELAEQLRARRLPLTVNALHPGVINTKLLRTGFGAGGEQLVEGAETPFYLATSAEVAGLSGGYFVRKQAAPVSALAQDAALRKRFWQLSAELAGLSV